MRALIFASLFLTACHEPIKVGLPPPPAEWMQCEALPVAPDLKPLERITLPDGRSVYLMPDVNARDSQIARYIVQTRGAWFDCSNNLAKVKDYHSE